MSIITLPYVGNSLASDEGTTRLVDRVVGRIVNAAHRDDYRDFKRWVYFYLQFVGVHSANVAQNVSRDSGPAARLSNFVFRVGFECEQADVYSPRILRDWRVTFDEYGRRVPDYNLRDVLELMRDRSEGCDRELFFDHLRPRCGLSNCDDCGDVFLDEDVEATHNDQLVCESCRANNWRWSDYYRALVHEDSARDAFDERGRPCVVDEDDENFVYNDDLGEWTHVDYQPRPRGPIGEYHSSKSHFCAIPNSWSTQYNRFLGVELEVECVGSRSPQDTASAIHNIVNGGQYGRRVFFERDGSLSNGFEIITQPMGLPGVRTTFEFLRDPALVAGLRSHRTSTCGLHVHVSRTGLSDLVIARAVTFVNDPGNDAFVTALARRYNTGYCKVQEKDLDTAHLSGDRYEAVNLTPRHTIEFRIFRGSLKFEAVVAACEFVHALLEYCARPEIVAESLTASAFLGFCATHLADDTATLRAYLSERAVGLFQHSEVA